MSRLPAVFHQIQDDTGAPVSGGKLYTYIAGTTTNKATYPTAADLAALTNANANPLVAGADGIVGPVYCVAGAPYKFVEKTSADLTLRTEDNVYSEMLTSDSLITRVKQIASNPVDYGAVGDGVADESADVQAAVDGATTNGVVDLLGLTFRCDSAITLRSGITLRNGTLNFANCTASEFVKAHGTLGSEILLTSNVAYGDGSVAAASVSGLAAGDLLSLYDTSDYTDVEMRGEIVEIESIAALVVNLHGPAMDSYATASSAGIKKMTTVDDVRMQDLTVVGAESVSGDRYAVSLRNCRRARLSRVTVRSTDVAAIRITGCYDVVIESSAIRDGNVGIYVAEACHGIAVRDTTISGIDTLSVTIANTSGVADSGAARGVSRFVSFTGGSITSGAAASSPQVTANQAAQHVKFVGVRFIAYGSAAGDCINLNCADTEISGCEFYREGTGSPDAIQNSPKVPNRSNRNYAIRITGNRVMSDGLGIRVTPAAVTGGSGTITSLVIYGNVVRGTGDSGITVNSGNSATHPPITTVTIGQNDIGGSISVTSGHATPAIGTVKADANTHTGLDVTGTSQSISYLSVSGSNVTSTLSVAVDIDNVAAVRLRGLEISASGTGGIEISACTSVSLVNVDVEGTSATCVLIDEAAIISITGGSIFSDDAALEIDNTTQEFTSCRITGTHIRASASGHGIEIDASDATRSTNLAIVGCTISTGTPGAAKHNINITGLIDGVVISGVVSTRGDDSAPNISIAGDAAGGVTGGLISGCALTNGTYGISASNITNVYSGVNAFSSMATGNHTGLSNATYDVTNLTTDRTWDADAAVVAETNDVLGTLAQDLELLGLVTET